MESIVTKLFLLFLVARGLTETILAIRQRRHILKHREQVPARFSEQIKLNDHQKAADYSVSKLNSGQFFDLIGVIILLIWTLGGGIQSLDLLAHQFGQNEILTGVIFFALFAGLSMLLGLPQSIYSTFVIEEKFGFNKTDAKTFFLDMVKGLLVGSILGLPLLYGILWIMQALGDYWWAYAWGFLTLFQFVLIWAYPNFIAPLFNKFSELEEGETKEKILELLKRVGFESNGLFVMDASKRSAHGNAYFTGFGKNKRIVFFDNLLQTLNPGEVEAVLAHELGHFKRKHVMKMLIKGVFMSLVGFAILGALKNWAPFYLGHGVEAMNNHTALLLFMLVSGVYTFFMTPLSALSSRKQEFEADSFAAEHADANDLINALVKLYKDNANTLTPDPIFSAYYHSHPPAMIRVEHLEGLTKA